MTCQGQTNVTRRSGTSVRPVACNRIAVAMSVLASVLAHQFPAKAALCRAAATPCRRAHECAPLCLQLWRPLQLQLRLCGGGNGLNGRSLDERALATHGDPLMTLLAEDPLVQTQQSQAAGDAEAARVRVKMRALVTGGKTSPRETFEPTMEDLLLTVRGNTKRKYQSKQFRHAVRGARVSACADESGRAGDMGSAGTQESEMAAEQGRPKRSADTGQARNVRRVAETTAAPLQTSRLKKADRVSALNDIPSGWDAADGELIEDERKGGEDEADWSESLCDTFRDRGPERVGKTVATAPADAAEAVDQRTGLKSAPRERVEGKGQQEADGHGTESDERERLRARVEVQARRLHKQNLKLVKRSLLPLSAQRLKRLPRCQEGRVSPVSVGQLRVWRRPGPHVVARKAKHTRLT